MHEYSIVASLVDRVQREVEAHPNAIVKRLHLKIGELAGVELGLLRTAFATFKERSVCEVAELEIEEIAALWQCPHCKRVIKQGAVLQCTACGHPAQLAAGDDIILERIEMELADV